MPDLRSFGSTSNRVRLVLKDKTTQQGKTGLTIASSGLVISTITDNEATSVSYTQAGSTIETITTLGTFAAPSATKCRFKEIDALKHPGVYELQFDDARFAVAGSMRLLISINDAESTILDTDYEIELTGTNNALQVQLADGVAHGGTPGSSTATLALATANFTNPAGDGMTLVGTAGNGLTAIGQTGGDAIHAVAADTGAALFLNSSAGPGLFVSGSPGVSLTVNSSTDTIVELSGGAIGVQISNVRAGITIDSNSSADGTDNGGIIIRSVKGNACYFGSVGLFPLDGGVEAATNGSPILVTSTAHGLQTGDTVTIAGAVGNTAANGTWFLVRVNDNQFKLQGSHGNGAYTGGGTWTVSSSGMLAVAASGTGGSGIRALGSDQGGLSAVTMTAGPSVQLGDGISGAEGLKILAGIGNTDAAGIFVTGAGGGAAMQLGDSVHGGTGLQITASGTSAAATFTGGNGVVIQGGDAAGQGALLIQGAAVGISISSSSAQPAILVTGDTTAPIIQIGDGTNGAEGVKILAGTGNTNADGVLAIGAGTGAGHHATGGAGGSGFLGDSQGIGAGFYGAGVSVSGFISDPPATGFGGGGGGVDIISINGDTFEGPNIPAVLTADYDFAKGTAPMVEDYAANGVRPTPIQALYAIHQMLMGFVIVGVDIEVKKLNASTTAFIVTVSHPTNPTSALRT